MDKRIQKSGWYAYNRYIQTEMDVLPIIIILLEAQLRKKNYSSHPATSTAAAGIICPIS